MEGLAGQFRFDGNPAAAGIAHGDGVDGACRVHGPGLAAAHAARFPDTGCCGCDAATGLAVALEGTLYNLAELARRLGMDVASMRPGDAQVRVLAEGWRRWGTGLAVELDGEFALVVLDRARGMAYAATDPAGARPLYYRYESGMHFSFASDAAVLAGLLGLDARIPESRLVEQLVDPLEILEYDEPLVPGVIHLPAAHHAVADRAGVRVARYWSPGRVRPALRGDDVQGWVEGFHWHLRQAVAKRHAAPGRVGVLLSGGLDSSSVLALAALADRESAIPTYSLVDGTMPGCPETRAIEAMNRHCRAQPCRIDIASCEQGAALARRLIPSMPRYLSGRAALHIVSYARAAEAGVNVLMDGFDADAMLSHSGVGKALLRKGRLGELVANRRIHHRLHGYRDPALDPARALASLLLPEPVRRWRHALSAGADMRDRVGQSLLSADALARFRIRDRMSLLEGSLSRPRTERGEAGLNSSLASLVPLDGVMRMNARAVACGVRLRHPFFDRALMDFAAWIPLELRLREGRTKWIMRSAMAPFLPQDVAWRTDKTHIGARFDRIVLQPVLDGLLRELRAGTAAVQGYVDRERLLGLVPAWQAGANAAVMALSPVLLLEWWLRHNPARVRFGA